MYGVADLHALTVRPERIAQKAIARDVRAAHGGGARPEETVICVQSHVPTHAQLAWILNCYTQFGEASRMTQFKEKSSSHADNINVGLFAYPMLMAADF